MADEQDAVARVLRLYPGVGPVELLAGVDITAIQLVINNKRHIVQFQKGRRDLTVREVHEKLAPILTQHEVRMTGVAPKVTMRRAARFEFAHRARLSSTSGRSSAAILEVLAHVLPERIVREDLGDFVERTNSAFQNGRWVLGWLGTASAVFWTTVNALSYFRSNLKGNRRGA